MIAVARPGFLQAFNFCEVVRINVNRSSFSDDTHGDVVAPAEDRLSEEDMQRVKRYLSSPVHSVSRKPFRPWVLIIGVWVLIGVLGLLSMAISYFALA